MAAQRLIFSFNRQPEKTGVDEEARSMVACRLAWTTTEAELSWIHSPEHLQSSIVADLEHGDA
jgi:hypothetical protein